MAIKASRTEIEGAVTADESVAVGVPTSIQSPGRRRRRSRLLWALLPLALVASLYLLPNLGTPEPFSSGGLGMTRAEWNKLYSQTGSPSGFMRLFMGYAGYSGAELDDGYNVWFWPEGWLSQGQARIRAIEHFVPGLSYDEARSSAHRLMPVDAQLVQTVATGDCCGTIYDVFHSASLETRYPGRLLGPDPWNGAAHGTINVYYSWNPVLSYSISLPSRP